MSIANDSQKLDLGELIVLFYLDTTALGGPILYFTQSCYSATEVVWNGNTYVPIDIEADGFEVTGQGTLPRPKIKVGNASLAIGAAAIQYQDLLGSMVTVTRTLKKYLDGEASADPTAHWPLDVYSVERKTAHNKFYIEWELVSLMDCEGRKIPGRQILRDACTHIYRYWDGADWDYTEATCPYTDTNYFDANGTACAEALDRCGKRLKDCELRFPSPLPLPTTAFPAVARVRIS